MRKKILKLLLLFLLLSGSLLLVFSAKAEGPSLEITKPVLNEKLTLGEEYVMTFNFSNPDTMDFNDAHVYLLISPSYTELAGIWEINS